jgi:hypothetical protein
MSSSTQFPQFSSVNNVSSVGVPVKGKSYGMTDFKSSLNKNFSLDQECGKKVVNYTMIAGVVIVIATMAAYFIGKSKSQKDEEARSRASKSRSHSRETQMKSEIANLQKLLSDCRGGGSGMKRIRVPPSQM